MSSGRSRVGTLSASSARQIMKSRHDSFDRSADTIRLMVDTAIKEAAAKGRRCVTINVPVSIFGHEPFDQVLMGKRLADMLFADGYSVTGTYSRMTIAWAEPGEGREERITQRRTSRPSSSSSSSSSTRKESLIRVPIPKSKFT